MREPKKFFRKQTQSWYVQIDGKQHPLGPDESEAQAKYHELMANRKKKPDPADLPKVETAIGLLVRFLEWEKANAKKASTFQWYDRFLRGVHNGKQEFIPWLERRIGSDAPYSKVTIDLIEDWLQYRGYTLPEYDDAHNVIDPGKPTTRFGAIRAIKRAFEWAAKRQAIPVSPIKYLGRGESNRRSDFNPKLWETIIAKVKPDDPFLDLLLFLKETGCRPAEAIRTTADNSKGGEHAFDTAR